MTTNSAFWATIATVIPVIGLAMAAEYKRAKWHLMRRRVRLALGIWRTLLVVALVSAENSALNQLLEPTAGRWLEQAVIVVVALGVMDILIVPMAPMMIIATHDWKYRKFERRLRKFDQYARRSQRESIKLHERMRARLNDLSISLSEYIIRNPQHVYSHDGSIRTDLRTSLPGYAHIIESREQVDQSLKRSDKTFQKIAKERKKFRKKLDNERKRATKRVVQLTNFGG